MAYEVGVAGNVPEDPEEQSGWVAYKITFTDGIENLETERPQYHQQQNDNAGVGLAPTGRVQAIWRGDGVATVQALYSRPPGLPDPGPLVGGRVVIDQEVVGRVEKGEALSVNGDGEVVDTPPEHFLAGLDIDLWDVATGAAVIGAAGAAAYAADRQLGNSQ